MRLPHTYHKAFYFFQVREEEANTQVPELPDTHYGSEASPVSFYSGGITNNDD